MAKVILAAEFLTLYLFNALLSQAPKIVELTQNRQPPEGLLYFLLAMMFIPEIVGLASREFRVWIKKGLEDADGELDKSDMQNMLILYSSLWSLRVFLIMNWSIIFYSIEIPAFFYALPLLGSFGIAGLTVLKTYMGKS